MLCSPSLSLGTSCDILGKVMVVLDLIRRRVGALCINKPQSTDVLTGGCFANVMKFYRSGEVTCVLYVRV